MISTRRALIAVRCFERPAGVAYSGFVEELGRARLLAEARPQRVARRGDVDVAVGGLEHAGAGAGRMVVAFLPRRLRLSMR